MMMMLNCQESFVIIVIIVIDYVMIIMNYFSMIRRLLIHDTCTHAPYIIVHYVMVCH